MAEVVRRIEREQAKWNTDVIDGQPITVEILTHDAAWIAKYGRPGHNGRTAITITRYVETTFGTKRTPMVRFDLGEDMPRGWGNRWAMIPRDHTSLAS